MTHGLALPWCTRSALTTAVAFACLMTACPRSTVAAAAPAPTPAPALGPVAPARPSTLPAADPTAALAVDGLPKGWSVRNWADVSQEPVPGARWAIRDGVLRGSVPRGTWLLSDAEFGDFTLECEFRLPDRGNAAVGLRVPPRGDPDLEALTLKLVDRRFFGANHQPDPTELSGSISKAIAPTDQVFLPREWNRLSVTCNGPTVVVVLNGKKIVEANLEQETRALQKGRPLSERPRRGRLAFLEASRGSGNLELRQIRLRPLD